MRILLIGFKNRRVEMAKYQIGDRVRITRFKPLQERPAWIQKPMWVDGMNKLLGKEGIIDAVYSTDKEEEPMYEIGGYVWREEWIE
jgi:hypothetical protein